MTIIKELTTPLDEKTISELLGKFIHVPTNKHEVYEPMEKKNVEVNAWFAGKVAGYSRKVFSYNYEDEVFFEKPHTVFNIFLCDGMSYALSEACEIHEITEEEFLDMLAEQQAKNSIFGVQEE